MLSVTTQAVDLRFPWGPIFCTTGADTEVPSSGRTQCSSHPASSHALHHNKTRGKSVVQFFQVCLPVHGYDRAQANNVGRCSGDGRNSVEECCSRQMVSSCLHTHRQAEQPRRPVLRQQDAFTSTQATSAFQQKSRERVTNIPTKRLYTSKVTTDTKIGRSDQSDRYPS